MKYILFIIFTISILIAPKDNGGNDKRESELFEYYWHGILMTESDNMHFKKWKIVISKDGGVGKAQLMPDTFRCILIWSGRKDLKQSDIYHPKHNEWAGKYYFSNSYFYNLRANRPLAISSYNKGTNAKSIKWKYVDKVLKKGKWQWWQGLNKQGR